MKVNLFGIGLQSQSRAITAQRRINCYSVLREDVDKTSYALVGRPGLIEFIDNGSAYTRGLWPVNTLSTPLLFFVQYNVLYSVNNAGVVSTIGTILTTTGNVSMVDDGTYLMLVDGSHGWYYNMLTAGPLTRITSGNFTTSPQTVTWQDTYFIVTSGLSNQFQLSDNADPSVWPAVNINYTGAASGPLSIGISDHSILQLYGSYYAEFWSNTGAPDFPFGVVPSSSQEFGLVSPWSLAKFDNSIMGLFQSKQGGVAVARLDGFQLRKLSSNDVDSLIYPVSAVGDVQGYGVTFSGHPMYILNMPGLDLTLMYDGISNIWSELKSYGADTFVGMKFANFQNRLIITESGSGKLLQFDQDTYDDDGDPISMEVWSKHIWDDDKYIGIKHLQIDTQAGVGTVSGQGENPVLDLQVSKDGGNSFYSVGFSSIGKIGNYTTRTVWNSLGAARDWVLKLVITDPVKRVITGASAEIVGGSF